MVGSNLQSIDMQEQNDIGDFAYLFYDAWLVGEGGLFREVTCSQYFYNKS